MKIIEIFGRKLKNFRELACEKGLVSTVNRYLRACIPSTALSAFTSKILNCWKCYVSKLKIRNDILVFYCESDMEDNARVLYEYMCANDYLKKYLMIWLVKDLKYCKKRFARKNVKFITKPWFTDSIYEKMRYYYYIGIAKFLLFTHPHNEAYEHKNKKGCYIHLGHGAAPIKARRIDAPDSLCDYVITPSAFSLPLNMNFWAATPEKMVILGAPRDDRIFYPKPKSYISSLINMEEAEKLIIVMPTFKQANSKNLGDSNIVDPYCLSVVETDSELYGLNELLKKQHMHMAVKIHPLQKMDHIKQTNLSNIHYLTKEILFLHDILTIDFLACGDALITDFSSTHFDFLRLNRPIAFLLNKMMDYTRGFVVEDPLALMPGEKIYCYQDMITFLNNVDAGNDLYVASRGELLHKMFKYNDQQNCKRLLEYFSI